LIDSHQVLGICSLDDFSYQKPQPNTTPRNVAISTLHTWAMHMQAHSLRTGINVIGQSYSAENEFR